MTNAQKVGFKVKCNIINVFTFSWLTIRPYYCINLLLHRFIYALHSVWTMLESTNGALSAICCKTGGEYRVFCNGNVYCLTYVSSL